MKFILPLASLALLSAAAPTAQPKAAPGFFTIFGSGMPNSVVPGRNAETRSELETIQLEERADAAAAKKRAAAKTFNFFGGSARRETQEMIRRITVERCGNSGC